MEGWRRMEKRRRRIERMEGRRRRRRGRERRRCVNLLIRILLYFHSPGFNFRGRGRKGAWGRIQWLLDQLMGEVQHHCQL